MQVGFGVSPGSSGAWSVATPDPEKAGNFAGFSDWELAQKLQLALGKDVLVEPDLRQSPVVPTPGDERDKRPREFGLAVAGLDGPWHLGTGFSGLAAARQKVSADEQRRVTIAHLDTGYDPRHELFAKLTIRGGRDFESDPAGTGNGTEPENTGIGLRNKGHGTGTLGILAGGSLKNGHGTVLKKGEELGGIPHATVVPVRVADFVAQFWTSSIAAGLWYAIEQKADVVTISLGGLPSQAWADAINACYVRGIVVVAAAGNNFGGFPTRDLVWPARFGRVIAACGIGEDQEPYIDRFGAMEGNFGPPSAMATAMAAYTPRIPWASYGTGNGVDQDGAGTSSATPQIAAAAALWLARHRGALQNFSGWQRVELVRAALFGTAVADPDQLPYLGRGALRADKALARTPADLSARLTPQPEDTAAFALLRSLGGFGLEGDPAAAMYQLEATHIATRSVAVRRIAPDLVGAGDAGMNRRIAEALLDAETMSPGLRDWLSAMIGRRLPAPPAPIDRGEAPPTAKPEMPEAAPAVDPTAGVDEDMLPGQISRRAPSRQQQKPVEPTMRASSAAAPQAAKSSQGDWRPTPIAIPARRLRIFASDPSAALSTATHGIASTTVSIPWEPRDQTTQLQLGPVGEYIEVIDIDPSSNCCYEPVDLDNRNVLAQDGVPPNVDDPKFHQQMVYAVAMMTIDRFERALGRPMLWQTDRYWEKPMRRRPQPGSIEAYEEGYVPRLRIYPHALRAANAYYSPDKVALLFGYFRGQRKLPGGNVGAGDMVFTCLSFDVIAHETTHALLDGVNRRLREASNPDVLAFHEAFADIVAIFQRLSLMDLLRYEITRAKGRLRASDLGTLAREFGQATGYTHALRDAINSDPSVQNYLTADRPHDRGAVLVAAVFDAFMTIYDKRVGPLLSIMSLPGGNRAIHPTLVEMLANEARKAADHTLTMCIRALDYLPSVDITFSDFLRAVITADADVEPEDALGYRVAFVEAFRKRYIFPEDMRTVSVNGLRWKRPDAEIDEFRDMIDRLDLRWDRDTDRREVYIASRRAGLLLHGEVKKLSVEKARILGLNFDPAAVTLDLINDAARRIARAMAGANQGWRIDRADFLRIILAFPDLELITAQSLGPYLSPSTQGAGFGLDLTGPLSQLVADAGPLFSTAAREKRARRFEVSSVRPIQRVTPAGRVHHDIAIVIQQARTRAIDATMPYAAWNIFQFRSGSTVILSADGNDGATLRYVITKKPDSKRRPDVNRRHASAMHANADRSTYFAAMATSEPFAMLHGH
ncbi:S8 family serine peptidase [Boseaceae bacterium BT-24-1]|nr:S8 family serine peptidase [Boseaceae bacterium BT-24-1]